MHRLRAAEPALRRRLSRGSAVSAFVERVSAPLDPGEVAAALVEAALLALPARLLAVAGVRAPGDVVVLAERGVGAAEEAVRAAADWVVRHDRDLGARSARHDSRLTGRSGALVAMPLRARGQIVGALVAGDRAAASEEPALSAPGRRALERLLRPAAIALDNALRIERAEALSVTDDLTQLYNSRYLLQALRREAKRSLRSSRPLSLLFIDLDGFKGVNDRHGHLAGSRTLVEVADVVRGCARETDVVARYGGDEFVVVLPETGPAGALAVARRVRERIAGARFLAADGLKVQVTASIGVASLPDAADTAEALIEAADVAMYRVKDHGKDGIHVATGERRAAPVAGRVRRARAEA